MAKTRAKNKSRGKIPANKKRAPSKAKAKTAKTSRKAIAAKAKARTEATERIKRLIRAQGESLLKQPNVTSVAIGFKKTGGATTGEPALQFTVERKLSPEALVAELIPPLPRTIEFEGVTIPTDVLQRKYKPSYQVVEVQTKPPRKTRRDPIQGGISVAHTLLTAGTIGTIVRDRLSGDAFILSNWHVLNGAKGAPGDVIVQPGPFDDNQIQHNKVGTLVRSHLGIAGDCAVATVENRKASTEIMDLETEVVSIGKPELGDLVVKSGRTTGVTFGQVSRVDGLFKLHYEGVGETAVGGFEIEPALDRPALSNEISKGGDSGSVWMAVDPKAKKVTDIMLGLHFGGDAEGSEGEFALACYAQSVFEKLDIEPLPSATALEAARKPKPAVEALRTGFADDFLGFKVPLPTFIKKVGDELKGLNGSNRINYCHFTVWLHGLRKLPVCVAWNIDGGRKKRLSRKGIEFVKDVRGGLDEFQVGDELYEGNDLDRGHVARRDDLVWGETAEAKQANIDSFFFSNMTPQHRAFNQSQLRGKWGLLENAILDDVVLRDLRVSVFAGPVLAGSDAEFRGVKLPREFWKIVFYTDDEDAENKARAFILTQKDLLKKLTVEALELDEFRWYQVPLTKIQSIIGIRFAPDLHRIDTRFAQTAGEPARLIEGANFFSS